MSTVPIADYALISDCRSAALVSTSGSIDWWCARRFDGPSLFARILDDDAGHWRIGPVAQARSSRRYLDETMVLQTTFRVPGGTAEVIDAMALGPNERGHDLGKGSPGVIVRRVTCTSGSVDMELEYAPRPEYGLIRPLLGAQRSGVSARGGADVLALSASVPLAVDGSTARAHFTLRAGETAHFALRHRASWERPEGSWRAATVEARLQDTIRGWRTWSRLHQAYTGPWRDLVHHSGRVLQALTFQPTGAIVAAPTTSLPESVGGERNWDYRYTWVRDSCLTLEALWVAACPDEAHRFFAWLAGAVASQLQGGRDLQIMFGVGGERDLSERSLGHLRGWRDSRPVRVGNGAWSQRQLDVYGELLGAARLLRDQLGGLDPATRRFLVDAAEAAAARWTKTDQGIWELRGDPRHFLYSKLMCWVALDCAVGLADVLDAPERVPEWTATRDEIRQAILERGWSDSAGAFTQAFDTDDLDASNLMMAITGFLPGDDPRMRATIDAVADRLTDDRGLVYRYRSHDGLEGEEGTFLLCTFWLAHAQALAGEVDRATATMERAVAFANDVGLLAEEVDPSTGELLGNFPQAFSHIGLINAAWAISRARPQATEPRCEELAAG
jgi:alpha,alpha-trehalase